MIANLDPVLDDENNLVLFDIYIGGEWHGSQRTYRQCQQYIAQKGFPEWQPKPNS